MRGRGAAAGGGRRGLVGKRRRRSRDESRPVAATEKSRRQLGEHRGQGPRSPRWLVTLTLSVRARVASRRTATKKRVLVESEEPGKRPGGRETRRKESG